MKIILFGATGNVGQRIGAGLIAGARQAGVNLVVVGGAGSLEVAPGRALVDMPGFPADWKPEALEHREALQVLRNEAGDLDWTFISPAAGLAAHLRRRTTLAY
jgi:putative NADH-flavin reductase